MFENRVQRRMYGPKREEVVGGRRRLHNEELHNLYASSNIIRVIKSRRMRWAGNVAGVERVEIYTKFWLGNLRGETYMTITVTASVMSVRLHRYICQIT
jgi:hypothetical protein